METKLKTIQDTTFLYSKTDTVPSEGNRHFQLIQYLYYICIIMSYGDWRGQATNV